MMFIYTLLTTVSLAASGPDGVDTTSVGATSPVASCQRVDQACSGWSQGQADSQCCSDYCHVMDVDKTTGFMHGLCETSCKLAGESCMGSSQYHADAKCCSGDCRVGGVSQGNLFGFCAKPTCQPLGASCQGRSFGQADSQCCSGNCNNLVLQNGVYYGHCETAYGGEKTVLDKEPVVKEEESSTIVPCQRVDQGCSGWSQGQANSQCCSDYCHVMDVDNKTGFMHGVCEQSCKLAGESCMGSSQYQADGKCCSGDCIVRFQDGQGTYFGICSTAANKSVVKKTEVNEEAGAETARPSCQPRNAACSGKYINDADAQCCSGSCGSLVFLNGAYHGRCERPTCQPLGASCQGGSFGQADSQCCSGNCNHLVLQNGVYYGHCFSSESEVKKTVVNAEKAAVEEDTISSQDAEAGQA